MLKPRTVSASATQRRCFAARLFRSPAVAQMAIHLALRAWQALLSSASTSSPRTSPPACHSLLKARDAKSAHPSHRRNPGKLHGKIAFNSARDFGDQSRSRCDSVPWGGGYSHHTRHPRPVHKTESMIRPQSDSGKYNLRGGLPARCGLPRRGLFSRRAGILTRKPLRRERLFAHDGQSRPPLE